MPDPTLSPAIKEAYASAPTDQVIYHTLEIWHPIFSAPIRVVRDNADLSAKIEATAARNPGTMQTFSAYAFDIVPPDQSTTALPHCTIEIDNVAGEILAQVDLAVMEVDAITTNYRAYLSDALTTGPENLPPLEMSLTQISATPQRIRAVAGFANLLDRKFPMLEYNLEDFPGLLE